MKLSPRLSILALALLCAAQLAAWPAAAQGLRPTPQIGGRTDYPVFTTKAATDLNYLVCARAMIAARRIEVSARMKPGCGNGTRVMTLLRNHSMPRSCARLFTAERSVNIL